MGYGMVYDWVLSPAQGQLVFHGHYPLPERCVEFINVRVRKRDIIFDSGPTGRPGNRRVQLIQSE